MSFGEIFRDDPEYILVCIVAVLLMVAACVYQWFHVRNRTRNAWREGYRQALDVHQLAETDMDAQAIEDAPSKWDSNRGPSWKAGYRACLKNHSLPLSERDSQELWHDPYTDMDSRADIVAATNSVNQTLNRR